MKKNKTDAGPKIPARSELDPAMCWDLSPLYPSSDEWEKDLKRLPRLLKRFQSFQGRLGDSAETLRDAFAAGDELDQLEEKLGVYAHLKHDEDTADSTNTARQDRISARGAEIAGDTAWFEPELMAIPQKKFNAFRRSPVLAFYKRT